MSYRRWFNLLNILYWNLNRNSIEDYIVDCIIENDIDIAIFSEFSSIDFSYVEKKIGFMFKRIIGVMKDKKVTLFANKSIDVRVNQIENRYSIYIAKTRLKKYIITALHLQDRWNYETRDRLHTIEKIVADTLLFEKDFKCSNTIVIGDFNAGPFDEELISKYAFNSVLYKPVIMHNEYTNPNSDKIKRFYNPIVNYISESNEMYGSFYYDNDSMTTYWFCLDQILVRKDLVESIKSVDYLKEIKKRKLMKKNVPDKNISDHLPLVVQIEEV